jgi:hypothetical protein
LAPHRSKARRRLRPWLLPAVLLAALAPVNAKQTFASTRALAFGRFLAGTGGSIIVAPNGARSSTGGVVLLTSTATSASFTNSDNGAKFANATVGITLPTDGSVVLSSGANQMTLKSFTSSPSGTGVMSGGSLTILVGATLTVGANQVKGNYSGSFPVTINYQ